MENDSCKEDISAIKHKACLLCKNYLQGAWNEAQPEDIKVKQIQGGLSNLMFYCGLQKEKRQGREPFEVLLRFFGRKLEHKKDWKEAEEMMAETVMENVIFALLSERAIGPKLYGVFAGGRIEEYIPSTSPSDQVGKNFNQAIARKMAKIHRFNMPINRGSRWLFNILKSWLQVVPNIHNIKDFNNHREQEMAQRVLSYDYNVEIRWLEQYVAGIDSPIVFCHNDLQWGNVLFRQLQTHQKYYDNVDGSELFEDQGCKSMNPQMEDDQLIVIDYEFCSYNYRGFDIANHLCERMFDYKCNTYPYYNSRQENFPNKEEQPSWRTCWK